MKFETNPAKQISRKAFLSTTAFGLAGLASGTGTVRAAEPIMTGPATATSTTGQSESSGCEVCAIVIGSLRYPVIERLVKEGRMPVFRQLMREGAWTSELLNLCLNKSHAAVISSCYPLTANAENTLKGIVMCRGPAIRRGFREHRPVFMEDIAPTLAHLLGIEPPADSAGRVLRRMLEAVERSGK